MASSRNCIDVAVALPVYGTFTYIVPDAFKDRISAGQRVLVPLGQRQVTGYVLGPGEDFKKKELKNIIDVLEEHPLFPASLIPFFKWIANYYIHPLGEVVKSALPGGLNLYEYKVIALTEEGRRAVEEHLPVSHEHDILMRLRKGPVTIKRLTRVLPKKDSRALIQSLEKKGWIVQTHVLGGAQVKPRMERFVELTDLNVSTENLSAERKELLEVISSNHQVTIKDLRKRIPNAPYLIRSLQKTGFVRVRLKQVYRDPFGESILPDTAPVLTDEQGSVVSAVLEKLDKGFATYLLSGVTGSGKTEVYLRLSAEAIARGYSVLVLVPEIVLISQMERRFRARFGERIAVLHSGLTPGERYDQWMRILRKEAPIVIGARSAIFAPLEEVGLIIVDEEHDTSYKQESGLRYNARDLAVVRARQRNCIALLGSATPSVQSYYNASIDKFHELVLNERVEKQPLPVITVVDLGKNRDLRGIRRFISRELLEAMAKSLESHEQVLLFLNRRGFAGLPICSACGESIRCRNCDISLTLHQQANAYKCHYCGFSKAFSLTCDSCGSSKIKLLGLGTEKVEAAVKTFFPNARVARMDRDTTGQKGSIIKILRGLRNQTIDVLVGTQMIAKGHDFPNITLVGIICADLSLSFPDFRAGERTFQLLAQVAGRAGRGKIPGRVVLQTYNPDHFSIVAAKDQDAVQFYKKEIAFRKALKYPPFSRIVQLRILGRESGKTERVASALGSACRELLKSKPPFSDTLEVLGPIPAPLTRIAKEYRWQILMKSPGAKTLHQFVHRLLKDYHMLFARREAKVVIDVDPFFMM